MRKKVLSAILAVVMCFTLLSQAMARPKVNENSKVAPVETEVPEVSESISAASGDVVIAVNTVLTTEKDGGKTSGGFSSETEAKESYADSKESAPTEKMTGISGYIVDEETGKILYQEEPYLPIVKLPYEAGKQPLEATEPAKATYTVGSAKKIMGTI